MGKTTAVAKPHFGNRLLRALGKSGITMAELSRRARVSYRSLQRWKDCETPPDTDPERIARVEAELGVSLRNDAESQEGNEMLREPAQPYPDEPPPRRYAQPLDFKKLALDACGRARHDIQALRQRLEDGEKLSLREMLRLLWAADHEVSEAQGYIMGKIELNDRGEKV